ncbi:dienelactone hydrolase family protein [Duganella dendranthematis]|nr:dienelactone hydrolase family protein [Duganella dendranthematis]
MIKSDYLKEHIMTDTLTIDVADGSFNCYVARPRGVALAPVIIVLQEIFGVNAGIRQIADEYAAQGYIAVAPDLFWRADPGLSLSEQQPGDWARGFALYSAYDRQQGVGDIAATVRTARTIAGASGKVGVTGYCLGGLMTYLTAARTDADAFVAYYGGATEDYAQEAGNVGMPLLYHLAEQDEYIGTEAQRAIRNAFATNPLIELYGYPGCNHAFARPNGSHYDPVAAPLANARTAAFFKQYL